MWFILVLVVVLGLFLNTREGYTDLTPSILKTTIRSNKVNVDASKLNILSQLIDNQTNQLTEINTIIATLKSRKNNV